MNLFTVERSYLLVINVNVPFHRFQGSSHKPSFTLNDLHFTHCVWLTRFTLHETVKAHTKTTIFRHRLIMLNWSSSLKCSISVFPEKGQKRPRIYLDVLYWFFFLFVFILWQENALNISEHQPASGEALQLSWNSIALCSWLECSIAVYGNSFGY